MKHKNASNNLPSKNTYKQVVYHVMQTGWKGTDVPLHCIHIFFQVFDKCSIYDQ
jgi:hypothetical protein